MNYLGRGVKDLYQGVKDFYSELNPATLTGIYLTRFLSSFRQIIDVSMNHSN